MQTAISDKSLTVYLSGEIDHHNAAQLRQAADKELIKHSPEELIIDFTRVTFMDSSGVGLVMGRYKTAASIGCKTVVTGLRDRDKKILQMSGLANKVEFR